jgi:hypothetical protein
MSAQKKLDRIIEHDGQTGLPIIYLTVTQPHSSKADKDTLQAKPILLGYSFSPPGVCSQNLGYAASVVGVMWVSPLQQATASLGNPALIASARV